MCAIVDANVAGEVFGPNRPPAGGKFLDWINNGSGRLVIGGKLFTELSDSCPGFRDWAKDAQLAGKMRIANKISVAEKTEQIRKEKLCRSDDPHILALAQISGARLLYSNDVNLQHDFSDKKLIDNPRGKVYSTLMGKELNTSHRSLLKRTDLCQSGK